MALTTVVDYGTVNLANILRALQFVGANVEVTQEPERVLQADRLIVPGVGAFAAGMAELRLRGLDQALIEVAKAGRSILGICLGMQMFFDTSTENGRHQGLSLIPGEVITISKGDEGGGAKRRKVPHIGWNEIHYSPHVSTWEGTCLNDTAAGAFCYFAHSFMVVPESSTDVLAQSNYEGLPIVAAIAKDNITGLQFHPERSGPEGLKMLEKFVSI